MRAPSGTDCMCRYALQKVSGILPECNMKLNLGGGREARPSTRSEVTRDYVQLRVFGYLMIDQIYTFLRGC